MKKLNEFIIKLFFPSKIDATVGGEYIHKNDINSFVPAIKKVKAVNDAYVLYDEKCRSIVLTDLECKRWIFENTHLIYENDNSIL